MTISKGRLGTNRGRRVLSQPLPDALRAAYAILAGARVLPEERSIVTYALAAIGRAMRPLGESSRLLAGQHTALAGTLAGAPLSADNDALPGDVHARDRLADHRLTFEEASAHYHAEEALEVVGEASAALASPLPVSEALSRLCEIAVPRAADACIIDTLDEGELRPVACAHADVRGAASLKAGLGAPEPLSPTLRALLEKGLAMRLLDASGDRLAECFGETRVRLLQRLAHCSAIAVPLVSQGRAVGLMTVAADRVLGRTDVLLAEVLARRAAQAIDNARLLQEAQRASRQRDEFLAAASHELRTPLTLLQIEVQGLLRAARRGTFGRLSEEQLAARLESANLGCKRLAHTVSELLDVTRLNAGPLPLHKEDVDLSQVVQSSVAMLRTVHGRSAPPLHLALAEGAVGRWDRQRLTQLVGHLLSNAVKYGAGRPVEITVTRREHEAFLVVRDHGIGIAPHHLARIFERYERAVSDRHYGGLGLGLYLVRRIAVAFGGGIEVSSELGQGTVFTVRLPLVAP